MKRSHIALAVAAGAALLTGGIMSASATASDRPAPPPRPPWVNADGTVDQSKVPDTMPVMGPDGKPLKDANGKQVTVKVGPMKSPSGPQLAPKANPKEKRWTEKDENGTTIEHVEVEPSIPTAD